MTWLKRLLGLCDHLYDFESPNAITSIEDDYGLGTVVGKETILVCVKCPKMKVKRHYF